MLGGQAHLLESGHVAPKCVLTNGMALSAGDWFPYLFRRAGLGKVIGTRTMGALLGAGGVAPALVDGGRCDPPHVGFYEDSSGWAVEGRGVEPDIVVLDDPAKMAGGRDPQLDAATEEMLRELPRRPRAAAPAPPRAR
jgi:tricorn protease